MAAAKSTSTHGDRIRTLFKGSVNRATVVAPFIKVDALRSLLDVIRSGYASSLCHALASS